MSRILYLDCPTGIAGDMLLAALLDAGGQLEMLQSQLSQLDLGDWQDVYKRQSIWLSAERSLPYLPSSSFARGSGKSNPDHNMPGKKQ